MTLEKKTYIYCDRCNPHQDKQHPGVWIGTVKVAILHGWYRPYSAGSGGGNGAARHYCPKCKPYVS